METLPTQDNSSAGTTGKQSIKDSSLPSTINVVTAFKRHRLYEGLKSDEVVMELERLAEVSIDYPDEDVLFAIRCLTERMFELYVEGDGDFPNRRVHPEPEAQSSSPPDALAVEVHEAEGQAPVAEGVLPVTEISQGL